MPLSAAKVFKPRPLDGWALQVAVNLDTVSPNFLSFLFCTSALRRQVIFAALATLKQQKPETLASCLLPLAPADCNSCRNPYEQIARALMVTSRAREIVRAAFGQVPNGFLGILQRLGDAPLSSPALYWTLCESLSNREHRHRARALMQRSGPISAKHIEIVHRLDPVLVHRNILDRMHSVDQIESANAALTLIRRVVSTASDEAIRQSVEHLQPKTDLSDFFSRWLNKMDRPPAVPPIPKNDPDFAALTTGEAMIALGRRYQNCAAQQVPLVATGSHAYIEWLHDPGAIADCRRTTDGRFVLVDIFVHRNGRPSPALCATVRRKLEARGIPALFSGDGCPRVRDVLHLLGMWDTCGDLGFGHEADMEEGLAALEQELSGEVADAA